MIDYLQKVQLSKTISFVIGGLGLIGREISIALATAGSKTIILDVNDEAGILFSNEMCEKGYDVGYKRFDCSNMNELDYNYNLVIKDQGSPDIFVNCSYPRTNDWNKCSFQDITLQSFQKNVDIHMNSYAWLARLVAENMIKQKISGSIIQLSSIYGILGQDLTVYEGANMHENMAYATIKGGITNLTRQMASYYGNFNIRINSICPGGVQEDKNSNIQNPVFVERYSKKVPLKRMGRADEIASTALFLASNASSYITGTNIIVDGGWSIV